MTKSSAARRAGLRMAAAAGYPGCMKPSRRIVITGATRGLGAALWENWRDAGHTVFGCGRAGDPARNLDAVDVTDATAVNRWADSVLAGGAPDLLVNNAALMNTPAPLWQVPAMEFDRLIDVNVKGVANVIRAFAPAMARAGRGVIVNLSSGWGRSTSPGVAPYCASKYAVEGLSAALAQDLPPGLACIALNPGIIHTDMLRQCWAAGAADYPPPADWVRQAAPFILSLGPRHNGGSLTVPGQSD